MPTYTPLPTLAENDNEATLLEKSSTEDLTDLYSASTHVPSKRVLALFYVLCTLAVLFSGTNVAAGIRTYHRIQANHAPIDTLAQPDIYVGLPKHSKVAPNTPDAHSHTHGHVHEHSHNMN